MMRTKQEIDYDNGVAVRHSVSNLGFEARDYLIRWGLSRGLPLPSRYERHGTEGTEAIWVRR